MAKEINQNKKAIDQVFDEDVYKLDGKSFYKRLTVQFSGFFTRLFSGVYRRLVGDIQLCKKDGKKPNYKRAVEWMGLLYNYQEKSAQFKKLQESIEKLAGRAYVDVNSDFERCVFELEHLAHVQSKGVAFGKLLSMQWDAFDTQKPAFAALAADFERAFVAHGQAEQRLAARFDEKEYALRSVSLELFTEKCEQCYDNTDKLDNWCEFVKLLNRLTELELRVFVDETIEKKVATDQIVRAYKKVFYLQWIDVVLRETPVLSALVRVPHDETVKKFREKDALHFGINKAKIKAELSHRRPTLDLVAQGSSVFRLLREGVKKRKQKGIRALLSDDGDLVQTLKPCFLMSPLSVSTYLSSEMKFDVVVFDEASQIFPQDAVGAIYRGEQLIVVGDSKQMPPSNFFTATVETDLDDETEDVTDFESILDICSTAFPQRRLKWHYRSRYEGLIAFSNKHFYDNDLVTFPSAVTDKEDVGVDYVHVDGVFDRRTKTNRAEAEKIVDMVFEHIERYPDRSLGVVAFSISQQELIDRLISKRRQQDSSKDEFFRSDKVEPFFVKNLETVQGDERDTILFSIAYAKDAQGKFLLNFGPINREGGERRLNVAVTRAKQNVKVVASIRFTDINLAGSKSVGARMLRDYLEYAEKGGMTEEAEDNVVVVDGPDFEAEVGDFLRSHGYEVHTQVGCSSFKIDLAVKRPDTEDYVLAVECDGLSYSAAKTARDRDRLRQDVLERMGWSFYRIWSTDWYRNKRVEQERLLLAVKEAFAYKEKHAKKAKKSPMDVSFEESVEQKRFEFPKYQKADELSLAKTQHYDIVKVVQAMVKAESPLNEEWMLKRIVFLFGQREKVTSVVRKEYEALMWDCQKKGIVRKDGFLYWVGKEIPMLRVPKDGDEPREIKYVEDQELANGLRVLLEQNVMVEKDGLFRLLAAQLGFARAGDAIYAKFESALSTISNELEVNGETLALKN